MRSDFFDIEKIYFMIFGTHKCVPCNNAATIIAKMLQIKLLQDKKSVTDM